MDVRRNGVRYEWEITSSICADNTARMCAGAVQKERVAAPESVA